MKVEKTNNFTETAVLNPDKITLENIPNELALEERFNNALSVPEGVLKKTQELGGDTQVLMERFEPVVEKIKKVVEKIRSRAKLIVWVTAASLFAHGLIENKEIHNPIQSSKDNPQMVKERTGAYVQGKSEWFAEHIQPFGYTLIGIDKVIIDNTIGKIPHAKTGKDRYDAWYLYLGLEQENGTFVVSPYKPSTSKNADIIYYRMPEKEDFILRNGLRELTKTGKDKTIIWDNPPRRDAKDSLAKYIPKDYAGLMGRYTVSKGKDEKGSYISYYDKWDLCPGGVFGKKEASEMVGVGKPFEIYGRIYYDSKTGNPIKTN